MLDVFGKLCFLGAVRISCGDLLLMKTRALSNKQIFGSVGVEFSVSLDNNVPFLLSNWQHFSWEIEQMHNLILGMVRGSGSVATSGLPWSYGCWLFTAHLWDHGTADVDDFWDG